MTGRGGPHPRCRRRRLRREAGIGRAGQHGLRRCCAAAARRTRWTRLVASSLTLQPHASLDGRPLDLTRKEFDLAFCLASRAARWSSATAARRGLAAALRRGRQDPRRPPVLAPAQARREGLGPGLRGNGARVGFKLVDPSTVEGGIRGRLALTTAAVTSIVVVAFVVPLAALLGPRGRARGHRGGGSAASLGTVLATVSEPDAARGGRGPGQRRGTAGGDVILADGSSVGAPAPIDSSVARARGGEAFTSVVSHGARLVFLPVRRPDGTSRSFGSWFPKRCSPAAWRRPG